MLLAIQIPFTDCRPFLDGETGLLPVPNWGDPDPGSEFVRSFGPMRPRLRGGIREWPGEGKFCNPSRALRFTDKLGVFAVSGKQVLETSCAFRRFLADGRFSAVGQGSVVSRLELGLRCRFKGQRRSPLNDVDSQEIISRALDTKVSLQNSNVPASSLITIGPQLAAMYLEASTLRSLRKDNLSAPWWFKPGAPLVILEYRVDVDIGQLPKQTQPVPGMENTGIKVDYCWFTVGPARFGVWFLGYPPENLAKEPLRRLRLNLFRLHAERESIKQILRLVAQKKIKLERKQDSAQRFQDYLEQAITLLSRQQRDGLPQSNILEVAQESEDRVTEGEAATLQQQLLFIRGNLRHLLKQFVGEDGKRIQVIQQFHIQEYVGKKVMNNQTITISGSTFQGDFAVVAAETIQNSFNHVAESGAKPELKTALEELHKAVAEMCKQLPKEKHDQVASDLEVLSKEAIAPEPRRKWYELSAEGLMDAAKAVGQVAAPVVTAVKAVLGLLA
jgi:uncharacterized protein YjgD (DUF1641 family)